MRITRIELRQVRRIKELTLDLSAPITLIAGPNGSCKTTLQKAVLAALFHGSKAERDSLISRFDPQTPPSATLHFECRTDRSNVRLQRALIDDGGTWLEGGKTLRGKGAALKNVQQLLPIDADAAASLLWGLQDDLARILESFPAHGHSLLTDAVTRGGGPDPKQVIAELQREFAAAKAKGKNAGALTLAAAVVDNLEVEKAAALEAERKRCELTSQHAEAKERLVELRRQKGEARQQARDLADLRKLHEEAIRARQLLAQLQTQQAQWEGLDEEIRLAGQSLQVRLENRRQLQARLRVARDGELRCRIEELRRQIKRVADAEQARASREKELNARKRPTEADAKSVYGLEAKLREQQATLDATGVRYTVASALPTTTFRITEDGAPPRSLNVSAAQTHEGIVGQVVIETDSLRVSASGKAEVSAVKRAIEAHRRELADWLARFSVSDREAFAVLLDESKQLQQRLAAAEKQRDLELKGTTLPALHDALTALEAKLVVNAASDADRQSCREFDIGASNDIEKALAQKSGEISTAESSLMDKQARRPAPDKVEALNKELTDARNKGREARAALEQADPTVTEPSDQQLKEIDGRIDALRRSTDDLDARISAADTRVTQLAVELRHAGSAKPLPSIEAELTDANDVLKREHVLQEARELLRERVVQKITELAAAVPQNLGTRVADYFQRMTQGFFDQVTLNDQLAVTGVREAGERSEDWQPHHLSCGERHQAALAIKVALARALTETHGPIFVILDDYLVHFDPARRAATEELLLDLTRDGKLQVILLTCHSDWAAAWQARRPDEVAYVDLPTKAVYYREPAKSFRSEPEA